MGNTNYFDNAFENRDLALDGMSEGVSKKGMEAYMEKLQIELLKGVSEKLEDTDGISAAIIQGWQGEARDAFLTKFSKAIQQVEQDLMAEYTDLLYRLSELAENYYEQDKKMMDLI